MSGNTFGTLFCVTSFGESHGPAIGCVVDGCPPGLALAEADIQHELDRRRPGTSRHVTQRRETDTVEILSGVFEGRTTGTPIALLIRNEDQRSKDYANIADTFRPGHADYTYWQKYGIRDYRGGGRQSARETAVRVAAGAVARKWLSERYGVQIRGHLTPAHVGKTLSALLGPGWSGPHRAGCGSRCQPGRRLSQAFPAFRAWDRLPPDSSTFSRHGWRDQSDA